MDVFRIARQGVRNQRYAEAKGVGEIGFVEAENEPFLSNEDMQTRACEKNRYENSRQDSALPPHTEKHDEQKRSPNFGECAGVLEDAVGAGLFSHLP